MGTDQGRRGCAPLALALRNRGDGMPIASLLAKTAFDPDTTALLASAFETAWNTVKKSGSPLTADSEAASTRERLAKRIIELGKDGERNPKRLVDGALAHLAGS